MQRLSLARQSGPLAMLLMMVIVVVATLRLRLSPYAVEVASSPFMPQGWEIAISIMLLFATAITTNRIAVGMGLFNDFCTLPLSLFAIIGCGIYLSPSLLAVSAAALMASAALMMVLQTLKANNNKELPLFGAILLGLATLCYPPAVVWVALLPLAALIIPLNMRQFVIMIIGYLLPIMAASYVAWYGGNELTSVVVGLWHDITHAAHAFQIEVIPYAGIALAAVVVAMLPIALVRLYVVQNSMFAHVRKALLLISLLVGVALSAASLPSADVGIVTLAAIPASILIAAMLNRIKGNKADMLYLALVVLMLAHLFFE